MIINNILSEKLSSKMQMLCTSCNCSGWFLLSLFHPKVYWTNLSILKL